MIALNGDGGGGSGNGDDDDDDGDDDDVDRGDDGSMTTSHSLPSPLTHMTISSPYRTGSMRNTVFYGHGAVHEMGPRATGQVAQSEVAHEHCTGTAATCIVVQSSYSHRPVVQSSYGLEGDRMGLFVAE